MYCSKCGNEIKDGYLFCDKCGTKVEIPEAPQLEKEPVNTTHEEVVEEVAPKQEGVSEDRLDEILSMLDEEKEEKAEETIEEKVEEKVEETVTPAVEEKKEEVSQERVDQILGMLNEKEDVKVEEPKIEKQTVEEPVITQESTPVVEPQPVQQTVIQEPVATTIVPETNRVATEVVSKPVTPKVEEPKEPEAKSNSPLGLISMIIGIACIPLAFFIKLWVIPIAIAGIIIGACHKGKDGKKTAGIALSAASIPIAVIVAIIAGIFGLVGGLFNLASDTIKEEINTNLSNSVFEADGYTLEYDYHWQKVSLEKSDGEYGDALEYRFDSDYLAPVGISSLSELETGLDFDASTKDGRDTLYGYFSEYWKTEGESFGKIIKENTKFKNLKDDIYYATFTYGKDENTVKGHYILIISKEANAVISMQTNCSKADPDDFMDEVEILLETIEIEKQDNIIVDDELASSLESMSPWNMYSSARENITLGKKISLEGTWKQLSDNSMCWKFEDGKFWYYESYGVTDDNYWYGTYEVYTGQDGLDKVGSPANAKTTVNRFNGMVTLDGIYGVVLKPTKIIMNGEDKSEEMISGNDWNYAWILVNHGDEGIEAQIANMNQGKTYFYVKTQD